MPTFRDKLTFPSSRAKNPDVLGTNYRSHIHGPRTLTRREKPSVPSSRAKNADVSGQTFPSSRVMNPDVAGEPTIGPIFKGKNPDSCPLKMGPTGCLETSVRNYHYTLRNIAAERSSHLLRGGNLNPGILHCSYAIPKRPSRRYGQTKPIGAMLYITRQRCLVTTPRRRMVEWRYSASQSLTSVPEAVVSFTLHQLYLPRKIARHHSHKTPGVLRISPGHFAEELSPAPAENRNSILVSSTQ